MNLTEVPNRKYQHLILTIISSHFNKLINSFMMELPEQIDLQSKSVDWFLYDRDLYHEKS